MAGVELRAGGKKRIADRVYDRGIFALVRLSVVQMKAADDKIREAPVLFAEMLRDVHDAPVGASRDEQRFSVFLNHEVLLVREFVRTKFVSDLFEQMNVLRRTVFVASHAGKYLELFGEDEVAI